MYSKYVLNSNWKSLSSFYQYDGDLEYTQQHLPVDGNINVTYTSYLSNIRDYSNNNYSLFFLSDKKNINSYIYNKKPTSSTNKSVNLIVYSFENNLISENTKFLNIFNSNFFFNDVLGLSENNFFEIEFFNHNNLLIKKLIDNIYYYLTIDDILTVTTVLTSKREESLDEFSKQKVQLNYILNDNKIIIYKKIQDTTYFLGKESVFDNVRLYEGTLDAIPINSILYYVKIGDLPENLLSQNLIKYKRDLFKNNLNIDVSRSIKQVTNNILFHTEYNNVVDDRFSSNYLTLKNQLDIMHEANNNNLDNSFREYTGIFTGGGREDGNNFISLNYKTNYYPIVLKSDKVTWFHIPNNINLNKILINDSEFLINGAVAGSSPIYSDKIWKKVGNYKSSSNIGNTSDREHTGQWLCSWLSAGSTGSNIWMDRFYNPSSFTPYQALKYNTNVEYTPEYKFLNRKEGITDVVSTLSLEPGVWYAYSHLGKKTATDILSGIKFLYKTKFDSFKNKSEKNLIPELDADGQNIYTFNGNSYSEVDIPKNTFYNNFSISFFATRQNWDVANINNVLGNYLDSGFSIINNNKFNPLIFYYNNKIIKIFNNDYKNIITIDTNFYLSGYNQEYTIDGIFRRDYNNNFHIITSNFKLLEFTANGTLVDLLDFTNKIPNLSNPSLIDIESYSNNERNGVIRFSNRTFINVNLLTNTVTIPTSSNINFVESTPETTEKLSVVIDAFDNIFAINGLAPIIKGTNIYYKSNDCYSIKVYFTTTNTINTYLSSTSGEKIIDFNFDNLAKTHLLYKNRVEEYDEFGEYLINRDVFINNLSLTACNITYQELLTDKLQPTIHLIDSHSKSYLLNLNNNKFVNIDNFSNTRYIANIEKNNFDLTNYNFIQGIINNIYPLPSYNFKFKLFNQLDYEDSIVLNATVLGETLDTGIHHFCVVFNSLEGFYYVYIDGVLYSKKTFTPKRYSFSNLLTNNIIVGTPPFYNGVTFNEFYNSNSINLFAKDLKIEKFKLYSNSLNFEEVKLLYYEKNPPTDITVNLKIGERNYLDTITRTFKHKMQGSKSNLINLYINNSLITDPVIQDMYNSIIVKDLTPYLPGYIKINKIIWLNTIESSDKLIVGNFSIKNSLTYTEDGGGL
jgi:hypothetical protein